MIRWGRNRLMTIRAIVFDGVGVLIAEDDSDCTPLERTLESKFGYYNFDDDFYAWAERKTGLERGKLQETVEGILIGHYVYLPTALRGDFPGVGLYLASNHLTALRSYLRFIDRETDFDDIFLSAEVGIEKTDGRFFELLVKELRLEPKEILFVDDDAANILSARAVGLRTLHFHGSYGELCSRVQRILVD
jgi:FMN phosphatase YigB (HAD superfamily)